MNPEPAKTIRRKKIGFTVFGNECKEIPADNFKLDDLVVERVQAAVGPGLAARKIPKARSILIVRVAGEPTMQNRWPWLNRLSGRRVASVMSS
jgi:hypothetical protein